MKRLLAIGLVALAGSSGLGNPEKPWFPAPFTLPPHAVIHYGSDCEPGKAAIAIAAGNGESALGLYVFSAAGHCVAWDDDIVGNLVDDRLVALVPADPGPYEVEIRNFGTVANKINAVFRGAGEVER